MEKFGAPLKASTDVWFTIDRAVVEERRERVDHLHHAGEVLVDHGLHTLGADLEERREERAAGVVHQDVDGPEFLARAPGEVGHTVGIADIEVHTEDARTECGHVDRGLRQALRLAVADRDVGTERGERGRGRGTDAARRAGDNGDLAVEIDRSAINGHRASPSGVTVSSPGTRARRHDPVTPPRARRAS